MRKKIFFFIGIVLLCLVGWGVFLYNKPHQGIGNIKSDITIQADSLYAQYSANEKDADTKFLNKVISVRGTVAEVSQTDSTCIVLLKRDADMGGVSCNLFLAGKKDIKIKQGDVTTIKGRCTGFLMDVALTDCLIEQQ